MAPSRPRQQLATPRASARPWWRAITYHELLSCAANCGALPGPELHEVLGGMLRESPGRASHRAPVRLAGAWIDDITIWRETFRLQWRESEVSNVVESRMLLYALRHASRSSTFHSCRIMLFTDNLAALSIVSRGRSSARSLRFVCRGVAAYSLGWHAAADPLGREPPQPCRWTVATQAARVLRTRPRSPSASPSPSRTILPDKPTTGDMLGQRAGLSR